LFDWIWKVFECILSNIIRPIIDMISDINIRISDLIINNIDIFYDPSSGRSQSNDHAERLNSQRLVTQLMNILNLYLMTSAMVILAIIIIDNILTFSGIGVLVAVLIPLFLFGVIKSTIEGLGAWASSTSTQNTNEILTQWGIINGVISGIGSIILMMFAYLITLSIASFSVGLALLSCALKNIIAGLFLLSIPEPTLSIVKIVMDIIICLIATWASYSALWGPVDKSAQISSRSYMMLVPLMLGLSWYTCVLGVLNDFGITIPF